ncbi:MAG: hypothetical protein AAF387_19325 [Pseudomonadota bacterium]
MIEFSDTHRLVIAVCVPLFVTIITLAAVFLWPPKRFAALAALGSVAPYWVLLLLCAAWLLFRSDQAFWGEQSFWQLAYFVLPLFICSFATPLIYLAGNAGGSGRYYFRKGILASPFIWFGVPALMFAWLIEV